jgi:hypothetical protein
MTVALDRPTQECKRYDDREPLAHVAVNVPLLSTVNRERRRSLKQPMAVRLMIGAVAPTIRADFGLLALITKTEDRTI